MNLNYVRQDGRWLQLVPSDVRTNENVYTVIIGKNGVGKSKILAEIAREAQASPGLEPVIAISTSPFDKFPLPSKRSLANHRRQYRYIGMRDSMFSSSSAVGLIGSAMKGLLEKLASPEGLYGLTGVFGITGISPHAQFIFKVPTTRAFSYDFYRRGGAEDGDSVEDPFGIGAMIGLELNEVQRSILGSVPPAERPAISDAIQLIGSNEGKTAAFRVDVDFATGSCWADRVGSVPGDILAALATLLEAGVIRLMDVRLFKPEYGEMSLKRASSGEQCLLVLMLGIAGHIRHGSLILIDEPEISLHPQWQETFMELLIRAFSGYRECQFVIATHSPQIVSRMRGPYCFVTSLSSGETFSADSFSRRSADYQLAELFEAPGLMNEYISRLAFNTLAKIRSQKVPSPQIELALQKLEKLLSNVERDDPVRELVMSVREVFNHAAHQ